MIEHYIFKQGIKQKNITRPDSKQTEMQNRKLLQILMDEIWKNSNLRAWHCLMEHLHIVICFFEIVKILLLQKKMETQLRFGIDFAELRLYSTELIPNY